MSARMKWTLDMDARLARGLRSGRLHREMAAELGVSRNACIGRANRIGVRCDDVGQRISKAIRKLDHDAMIADRVSGMKLRDIAKKHGCTIGYASNVSREVARLARVERAAVVSALAAHAERRSISAAELQRRIIKAVIRDGLVDAVLDDAEAA
jgi:hypothetical protein